MRLLVIIAVLSVVLLRPLPAFAASPFDNFGNPFQQIIQLITQAINTFQNSLVGLSLRVSELEQKVASGSVGVTGATGSQGETGATGAIGAKGDSGPAGPTGATGVVDQFTLNNLLTRISNLESRVSQLEATLKVTPTPIDTPTPTPTPIIGQQFFVVSDNSWKYSDSLVSGWLNSNFDDSSWSTTKAPSDGLCDPSAIDTEGRMDQHGAMPMWTQNPVSGSVAYFRKIFTLSSLGKGLVRALFDDDGDIYINGNLVLSSHNGFVEGVQYADISQYLQVGTNIIGIKGIDAGGCQSVQFELGMNQPLNDDLRASTLNTNFWEFFSTNGGMYSFDNGSIVVPGGSSMFYIRTKNNPFPVTGTFSAEFGIQYTIVDESGVGVALGFEQQNGYDPSNVPVAYWQGSNFGLQVVRFGLTEATIGTNPDLNYHIGKISYDGDKYQVFLDGVLKYTSPSSLTAKSLWFGNPFCCRTNWTGFKLDYIKVTQP